MAGLPKIKSIDDVVADDSWSYTTRDGTRRISRVIIGRPKRWPDDKRGDWLCPLQIEHFTDGIRAIAGVGPVDALMNAMGVVKAFAEEIQPFTPRARATPHDGRLAARAQGAPSSVRRVSRRKKTGGRPNNPLQLGTRVVLKSVPPGFLDNLPLRDKRAITAIVGEPVTLVAYDDVGRAELRFTDKGGVGHYIYVKPEFIRRAE